MTKGTYNLNDPYAKIPNDTSYRNCICAMLIFVGMCVLIVVVATLLPRNGSSKSSNGEELSDVDAIHGDGFHTTQQTTFPSVLVTKLSTVVPPELPKTTHRAETTTQSLVDTRFGNKDFEIVTGSKDVAGKKQPMVVFPGVEERLKSTSTTFKYTSGTSTEHELRVDVTGAPGRGAEDVPENNKTESTDILVAVSIIPPISVSETTKRTNEEEPTHTTRISTILTSSNGVLGIGTGDRRTTKEPTAVNSTEKADTTVGSVLSTISKPLVEIVTAKKLRPINSTERPDPTETTTADTTVGSVLSTISKPLVEIVTAKKHGPINSTERPDPTETTRADTTVGSVLSTISKPLVEIVTAQKLRPINNTERPDPTETTTISTTSRPLVGAVTTKKFAPTNSTEHADFPETTDSAILIRTSHKLLGTYTTQQADFAETSKSTRIFTTSKEVPVIGTGVNEITTKPPSATITTTTTSKGFVAIGETTEKEGSTFSTTDVSLPSTEYSSEFVNIVSTTAESNPTDVTTSKAFLGTITVDGETTEEESTFTSTDESVFSTKSSSEFADTVTTTELAEPKDMTTAKRLLGAIAVKGETTEQEESTRTSTDESLFSTGYSSELPDIVTTTEIVDPTNTTTTKRILGAIAVENETTEESTLTSTEQSSFSTKYSSAFTDAVTSETTEETAETSSTDNVRSLIRDQVNDSLTIEKRSDEEEVVSEFAGDLEDDTKMRTTSTLDAKLKNATECNTKTCTSTISRILSLMDHSGDACNDFYEYSCGGASNAQEDYFDDVRSQFHTLLAGPDVTDALSFIKTFKNFYDSCISHEDGFQYRNRLGAVREIVDKVGHFVLDDTVTVDKTNLTKLFAKSVLIKTFPILKVDIDVDTETTKYILRINLPDRNLAPENVMSDWSTSLADERQCFSSGIRQSDATIDLKDAYSSYLNCRKGYLRYASAVENVIFEMDFFDGLSDYNVTQIIQETLYGLEKDVMQLVESIPVAEIQKATVRQDYEKVKISDLQKACDVIDWRLFFEELTGNSVPDDMPVQIAFYKKIRDIMWIFKERLKNNKLYNLLLILYATDVYSNTVIPRHKEDRPEYCLDLSTHLFHDVSTYTYINSRNNTHRNIQDGTLVKIFDILKSNLVQSLQSSEWLDDEDKEILVRKAKDLRPVLGSQSIGCLEEKKLTEIYDQITLRLNFSLDLVTMKEHREKRLFSLAGKDFNEQEMFCYFLRPFDVQPKSFYAKGEIALPYGLLRHIPLDVPGYVMMARVGIHLAQEMARHFDPIGIVTGTPLSPDGMSKYKELETKLYYERQRKVNKQNVKIERLTDLKIIREVADNAAVRMVTDAYNMWQNNVDLPWIRESFSRQQIFFVTLAQEFCQKTPMVDYMLHIYEREIPPPALRIEIMLANSKAFSDAFECREGTIMNSPEMGRMEFPHLDEYNE